MVGWILKRYSMVVRLFRDAGMQGQLKLRMACLIIPYLARVRLANYELAPIFRVAEG